MVPGRSDSPDDSGHAERGRCTRRRAIGVAAAAGVTGLAGCTGTRIRIERTETTVERQFDAIQVSQLEVTNPTDGDVTVTSR